LADNLCYYYSYDNATSKDENETYGESIHVYSALITFLTVYDNIKYSSCDVNHVLFILNVSGALCPFCTY